MLIAARQARTANRFAPSQTRRTTATASIYGKHGPNIALWLNPYAIPVQVGTAVAAAPDCSPRRYAFTQSTASKQPLIANKDGIKALQYDGINDCLVSSVVTLSSTGMTCIAMTIQTSGVGIVAEASDNTGSYDNAFVHSRGDGVVRNCVGFFKGNVGLQYLQGSAGFTDWVHFSAVCDKTLGSADEMKIYGNGNALALLPATRSDNTGTFGNYAWNIGARNNGVAAPFLGWIAQVFVFAKPLTDFERIDVYRSTREICGLGWLA